MQSTTKSYLALGVLAQLALPALVLVANPNLVVDGGFENPVNAGTTSYTAYTPYGAGPMGGWTVGVVVGDRPGIYGGITGSGIFPGANVTEGSQAFDLGLTGYASGNSISQALDTVAGVTYQLAFDWGSEYAAGVTGIVTVGALAETLVDPSRFGTLFDKTSWIVHSSHFSFVAQGNDTLKFQEFFGNQSDFFGLVVDNVSVSPAVAIPEPSGFVGFTLLFAPLGVYLGRLWNRR
jgi:Protein of unknown function (DUF642)